MARRGQIVLDPAKRTVQLVLTDGINYATAGPGESSTTRFLQELIIPLDPNTIFPPTDLARGPDREDDCPAARRHRGQGAPEGIAAQRGHGDPRQVLDPGGLPRLRR